MPLTGLYMTYKLTLLVTKEREGAAAPPRGAAGATESSEVRDMVIFLGLAAAVLYGSGDFLGGMATRRLQVLPVLLLADVAGLTVALAVALMSPGSVALAGLAWGIGAGLIGGLGLIIFYIGLATGPMSVVAPVAGLVSTVLPVGAALAEGERPGIGVYAGAVLCLVAIVMTSAAGHGDDAGGTGGLSGRPGRGRAIGYGVVAGAAFGLFFLLIKNAGESGEFWPVAAGRIGELAVVLIAAAVLRRSLSPGGADGRLVLAAAGAGAIDVVANICYVAATRTGAFGLAVVLASLYPGFTVLLARVVLGERLRWVQRGGLALAAIGILLVTV
jgi:drug/metabolite transporter (DMT)-like permease